MARSSNPLGHPEDMGADDGPNPQQVVPLDFLDGIPTLD